MRVNVAKQPDRFEMVVWDGTNVDEVNEYIRSVNDPTGTAEVVVDEDGNARVVVNNGYDVKPLSIGAFVHASSYMWGGPIITVYSPAEANAQLYTYPTFDPVADATTTS